MKRRLKTAGLTLAGLLFPVHAAFCAAAQEPGSEAIVRSALAPVPARWRDPALAVYAARHFEPLWLTGRALAKPGLALLGEIRDAESRGLRAADYGAPALSYRAIALASNGAAGAGESLGFDVALTVAAARFVSELHAGRIAPRELGYDLDVPHSRLDLSAVLTALASAADMRAALDGFEPQFHHYRLLKNVLSRYRQLSAEPFLTQLPALARPRIEPGEYYAGAPALRRLLRALGDLNTREDPGAGLEYRLDPALSAALTAFQKRHGLLADGVLGRDTYRELTVPCAERVRQIERSLERWRWLPPKLQSPPIIVNIPQFRLFAFSSTEDIERDLLRMNVIVGRTVKLNQTPVFAADLRYIVLNPYWDVPRSILMRELMPSIRADPSWIARNDYEIVRGDRDDSPVLGPTAAGIAALAAGQARLRQRPGPRNPLGFVKFMLPNGHNVYLHATPAQSLFSQARRTFSHGCIRIEEPMALLELLLRQDPGWTPERLAEALQKPGPYRIPLKRPVRVFIVYATALAAEDGRALFFSDIYRQDERLQKLLDARGPLGH